MPFLRNTSRCGLFFAAASVGGDVIDFAYPGFMRPVIGKRHVLRFGVGVRGSETQQFRNALAVRVILADAFLERAAERLPEGRELVLVVGGQVFHNAEHAPHRAGADRLDVLRCLKNLARDVERQIVGIDAPRTKRR